MLASEARVWLVEDSGRKQADIMEVVEASGGQIVQLTIEERPAYGLLADNSFPSNIGGANVVLLDNELEVHGRPSGDHIFGTAFRTGLMHGVKHGAAIGLIAIGESTDDRSDVSINTGANFFPSCEEDPGARWAELLASQPANPFIPAEGLIQRLSWRGGLEETVKHVLGKTVESIVLLSVSRSERVEDGETVEELGPEAGDALVGEEVPIVSKDDDYSSLEGLLSRPVYTAEETEEKFILSHSSQAVIATDSKLMVVRYSWERNLRRQYGWEPAFWYKSESDVIDIARLAELPSTYWDEVGFTPSSIK